MADHNSMLSNDTESLRFFWLTRRRDLTSKSLRTQSCSYMDRRKLPYSEDLAREREAASAKYYTALTQRPNKAPRKRDSLDPENDRNLTSAKYYTAVTRRPKKPPKSPAFDALTRSFEPIPNLFDDGLQRRYTRKSIDSWEQEVSKRVPKPMELSVPYKCDTPDPELAKKPVTLKFNSGFYYNAKPPVRKRNYYINPEWASERLKRNKEYEMMTLDRLRRIPSKAGR